MSDGIDTARADGVALAQALDGALRAEEAVEREARLAEAASAERTAASRYDTPMSALRLRSQVEELLAFRGAVLGSRVWRTAQAARRVFGRAW